MTTTYNGSSSRPVNTGSYVVVAKIDHPNYTGALDRVAAACRAHGKAAGILIYDTGLVPGLIERGFTFIGIGADAGLVADGAKRILAAVRG